jgi:hypothetical protein
VFLREFENEVQAAFPPRWMQRAALAPLAWLARRRPRMRSLPQPAAATPPRLAQVCHAVSDTDRAAL